jgi:rRNA-processing protein FCF1
MTLATKKTVVVDTNLFLHYKRPDQLNWKALQSANVELVIMAVVIRELEKVKNFGSSSRLKTRAADSITWLSKLMDKGFEVELRTGLRLKFQTTEPIINFADHSLIRELQDDVLIAGLINLTKTTPGRPVLATADLGVKSKARQRDFEVFAPLETDRLPEEPDFRDKELLELRKENLQLKNRQPRLKIAFANRTTRLDVLPSTAHPRPAPLTLDAIKQQYPLLEKGTSIIDGGALQQLVNVLNVIPESRRGSYNEKLHKFYYDHAKYLDRVEKLQTMAECRVELQFLLVNEGTAPATDIDVVLTFPEGAFVFKDLKLMHEPKPPVPPEKPISALVGAAILDSQHRNISELPRFSVPPGLFPQQVLNWSVEVKHNTVHFRLDRLKPDFDWPLQTLWLQLPNKEALQSTTVRADVSAAESSGRAEQTLHIIVK